MEVRVDDRDSVTIAALSGSFDAGDESIIAARLQPLVAKPESRLLVDLSGLQNINSLGLSELINVVVRSRLNRSRVVLAAPQGFVRGVFQMTRLDGWFEIFDDLPSATGALRD